MRFCGTYFLVFRKSLIGEPGPLLLLTYSLRVGCELGWPHMVKFMLRRWYCASSISRGSDVPPQPIDGIQTGKRLGSLHSETLLSDLIGLTSTWTVSGCFFNKWPLCFGRIWIWHQESFPRCFELSHLGRTSSIGRAPACSTSTQPSIADVRSSKSQL